MNALCPQTQHTNTGRGCGRRQPSCTHHSALRGACWHLAGQIFPSNPQVSLSGAGLGYQSSKSGKNRPFPLVSLPDEYYSTTYNIYKSSSRQLPKDERKTPLQTGEGCGTRPLRDSVVFAEACPSGFMVRIFSSETLETSKLRRL